LGFSARRLIAVPEGAAAESEAMTWRAAYEADAVKEIWLQFANDDGQFPLYPGQRTTIEYSYHVGADKWGPWFQRAIRMPTAELRVELDFPAETQVAVWGTVSSLSSEGAPLSTPIQAEQTVDRMTFTWSVRAPVIGARYRFEWRLPE
jgi:hypothetical protein